MTASVAQPLARAPQLNRDCVCSSLNPQRLRAALAFAPALLDLAERLPSTHPTLFASSGVFVEAHTLQAVAQAVAAIERVAALPAYQAQALAAASDALAAHPTRALSACMGYDFHLDDQGLPRLIEINTNAGGALINAALADAHTPCARACMPALQGPSDGATIRAAQWAMFANEWALVRGTQPLRHVAIVDQDPTQQYLAPEFSAYAALFESHGVRAWVADPAELRWHDGRLWLQDQPIDLVYNRLTDFYLQGAACAALRSAYLADAVVLTPHPRAHALLADKRNLRTLGDAQALTQLGASADDIATLTRVVPTTQWVRAQQADALWAQRRELFFKPASGYGGRATYRGRNVTHRVWGEILAGDYVAQALVPPGERLVEVNGQTLRMKFDLRAYTYAGQVQLLAARIYQGQTTNFRTDGSGFAPVWPLA